MIDNPTAADRLDQVLAAAGVDTGAVKSWTRLGDANFNSAYRIRMTDGDGFVLKIAPDPTGPAMTYEHDIMRTEALFYRRAAGTVPVPEVVHTDFTRQVVDSDVLLMTELPGANWYAQREQVGDEERTRLRTELGGVVAALHRVTGDGFGYPNGELAADWRTAFTAMLADVLTDAERFDAPLPWPHDRIRAAVARDTDVLTEVTVPVLVHYDLWAGNILVDGGRITGLVDGERAFWGDPLAEMVSLALFGSIADDAAFLAGYGGIDFTDSARRRLALYRTYLYLIMLIEGAPRGYSGPDRAALEQITALHLRKALAELE